MAKTPFKLRSGNNLGGRNGKGVNFKEMASSPVKENIVESFRKFMTSKQTKEGSDIGDIKRRMRHSNIEVRTKAQAENRARLKKIREEKVDKPRTDVLSKNIRDTSDLTVEDRASLGETVYPQQKTEGKDFLTQGFTREGDPYSYRTKEGGGYEFKSRGKGGRKKGEWYTAKGGVADIEKAYNKAMGIKE